MNAWVLSILETLSRVSPFFGRPLLEKFVDKTGKSLETVTAGELLSIIQDEINPSLSRKLDKGLDAFATADAALFEFSNMRELIQMNEPANALLKKLKKMEKTELKIFDLLSKHSLIADVREIGSSLEVRTLRIVLDSAIGESSLRVVIAPMFNENRAITGVLSIIQNDTLNVAVQNDLITTNKALVSEIETRRIVELELVRKQAQLIQSSKMSSLGEMAGNVAHEINTPLTIISLAAGRTRKNLEKTVPDLEKISEDSLKIEKTVERIAKIVRGLKTFSRSAENDPLTETRVAKILEDTFELCGERFKHHEIKLSMQCDPEITVECRPTQITQIIMNLLGNALDAIKTLPEKWVALDVNRVGNQIQITVTDSGNGIPPEVVSNMMTPFFSTKEVGEGTGLGLSISLGIAAQHRGRLYYDSNSPNTRFILELPAAQAPSSLNSKT